MKRKAVTFNVLKGGLGKSTLTKNTAAVLGLHHRVLVVDCDDNGHLTKHLGFKEQFNKGDKLHEFLDPIEDVTVDDLIYETGFGFDLLHSTRKMDHVELEIENMAQPDHVIRREIVEPLIKDKYDFILFDTPANKSLMTRNAIAASGNLIIPLKPGEQAKDGLTATYERLYLEYNSKLEGGVNLLSVVPNQINDRIDQHNKDRELLETINTHDRDIIQNAVPNFARLPHKVWSAIDNGELSSNPLPGIRRDSNLNEPAPITETAPDSRTMEYFKELANVVRNGGIERNENIADDIINDHKVKQ